MRVLPLTALALLALASPASAAVALDPLKPCYASDGLAETARETIGIHATGFTPATQVVVTIDGTQVAQTQANIDGTVTGTAKAPFEGRGERPFTLVMQETGLNSNPDNVVSDTSMVTNLSVTLRPKRANPGRKVRFSGRGFTKAAPIWGHYVFGGKVRKTIRLAPRPEGLCGVFHAKRRQIPVRKPTTGEWTLQVDQQRRYAPHPDSNAQLVLIRVQEVVKTP